MAKTAGGEGADDQPFKVFTPTTVHLPVAIADKKLASRVLLVELIYTCVGVGAAILSLIFGFILSISAITGAVDFDIAIGGAKSKLTNATPGALFVVIGLLALWVSRPKVVVQ